MVRCSGSARYARRCQRWGSRLNAHGEYWCHDHAQQEFAGRILRRPKHGWPVDIEGAMRCPTCFRRLRRNWSMDAKVCPSRRCPLGPYQVTSLELHEWQPPQ